MGFNKTYVGCYIIFEHIYYKKGDTINTFETEEGETFKKELNFSPITGNKVYKKSTLIESDIIKNSIIHLDYGFDLLKDYYEIPDDISPNNNSIIIPKLSNAFITNINDLGVTNIDFFINKAIEEFKNEHEHILKELEKVYDKVSINLGVIKYNK